MNEMKTLTLNGKQYDSFVDQTARKAAMIVNEGCGNVVVLKDSTDNVIQGLCVYGKAVIDGEPSVASPAGLNVAGANGSITVKIGTTVDGEALQNFTISTPNGLPGIPVSSGGNFTDADGQQWLCDEIDYASGVYTKRVGVQVFDGSSDESWAAYAISGSVLYRVSTPLLKTVMAAVSANTDVPTVLSNMFNPVWAASGGTWNGVTGISVDVNGTILCYTELFNTSDVTLWTAYLAEHPMTVVYPLATPVETAIADTEMEAYSALRTYSANTVITNDANAEISVRYVADIKTSIDNVRSFKDYQLYGLPVLHLTGDTAEMTKENAVAMNYQYQGKEGTCTVKWQGTSSLAYPKKNYTVKFDAAFEAKEGWGKQKKYCLKANYIDASHARNLISAKLWSRMVSTRGDGMFSALPNYGAVDGFPVVVEMNGEFMGLYTFNIPKDGWMFGLSDSTLTQAIVCAEGTATNTASAFKETANLDETDFSLEYASDEDNADWVKDSLNQLIAACINSDGSDLDTTVAQYLDWVSAIDYYIFATLIGAYDCITKNYLLVTLDGTKWYFSAYDMDSTFGLEWTGNGFRPAKGTFPTPSIYPTLHRVMELISTYKKDALKARYEHIRESVLTASNVHYDFYNFASAIPKIVLEEDWRKWPSIPNTSGNNTAQIMDWYRDRIERMDAEMEAL